ncbi:LptA/OstA family protein [Flaviflagellibacter deserti]|uniref:LptA/OstA family protein n=1 Tax=Flaviflagellibacter deserti TaxID=2267266 RepID=A0ABV9Z0H3_9HYPH
MTALRLLLALPLLAALSTSPSLAQQAVTDAFKGFSGRSDQPVKIEADRLDVRESDQAAIFTGNVFVQQGDSTLRSSKLTVFYDNKPAAKGAAPAAAAASSQAGRNIRRIEAEGSVVVQSKDQHATGDRGIFDLPSNTVTVTGNVVLTQGQNVLRGNKLVVDLTTQQSKLESAASGGRVQGVFGPAKPAPQ